VWIWGVSHTGHPRGQGEHKDKLELTLAEMRFLETTISSMYHVT